MLLAIAVILTLIAMITIILLGGGILIAFLGALIPVLIIVALGGSLVTAAIGETVIMIFIIRHLKKRKIKRNNRRRGHGSK